MPKYFTPYQTSWDHLFKIKKNKYRPVGIKNKSYQFLIWLWWKVFRQVEKHYPIRLAQGITQLVDIKEIDKLVQEFDWDKFQNEEEYRPLFSEEPTNLKVDHQTSHYHINLALQYLSQQV